MKYRREIIVGLVALAGVGCSSSDSSSGTPVVNPLGDATVVTNNPTTTYPWSSLVGKTNVSAFIRGAETGTTVYQRPIKIVSAYTSAGEDVFAMVANGTDAYGPGDSGSPILSSDGRVIGALYAGDDPQHVYGVSITQEKTTGQTAAVKRPAVSGTPASSWAPKQWFFAGSALAMPLVTKRSQFALTHYSGVLAGRSAPSRSLTPANSALIAGVRYASAILNGPDAQLYVSGTYTYQLPSGQWVATGHAIEGQGPAQWPVFPDYVDFIENDGTVESHIAGSASGTLKFDGPFGSLIDLSSVPTLLPVTVTTKLDGVTSGPVTHDTILDRGSSFEEEGVDLGGVLPVIALIGTSSKVITGGATITVYQGGVATQSVFPDNGLGTISTEGPETPSVFYNDLETAVDTAWANAYFNDPTTQVEKIVVSVTMTSSPFHP